MYYEYEIFFKYDDSWNYIEILYLMQMIQRIIGFKEDLQFNRTESNEVIIPIQRSSDNEMQRLLDRIHKNIIMTEPYKIEYRKMPNT